MVIFNKLSGTGGAGGTKGHGCHYVGVNLFSDVSISPQEPLCIPISWPNKDAVKHLLYIR
jgi:hypothetical protein